MNSRCRAQVFHSPQFERAAFFEKIVFDYLPPVTSEAKPSSVIDGENAAVIALMDEWLAEDATDDPDEIRKADEEVAELRRNLNANRAATGERLVSRCPGTYCSILRL